VRVAGTGSRFIDIDTAAKEQGVHVRTIRRWIEERQIPYMEMESGSTGKFFLLRKDLERLHEPKPEIPVTPIKRVSTSTVRRHTKYGYVIGSHLDEPGLRELVVRLYRQGWTMRKIGKELFIGYTSICLAFKRWGVQARPRGKVWNTCVVCGKKTDGSKRCPFCARVFDAAKSQRRRERLRQKAYEQVQERPDPSR